MEALQFLPFLQEGERIAQSQGSGLHSLRVSSSCQIPYSPTRSGSSPSRGISQVWSTSSQPSSAWAVSTEIFPLGKLTCTGICTGWFSFLYCSKALHARQ